MSQKRQAERVGQIHPYQITCTACDTRLIAVDREWIVLQGPRPIELVAGVHGDTHIACHHCGNMVLLDRDLLLLKVNPVTSGTTRGVRASLSAEAGHLPIFSASGLSRDRGWPRGRGRSGGDKVAQSVRDAVEIGYRHIDLMIIRRPQPCVPRPWGQLTRPAP